MKYMIMMFGGIGDAMAGRCPEWITGFHELMMKLDTELRESGELVDSQKLMDPSRARTVRLIDGAPVPTDGPFAEIKESLAGYWVIEASEERAVEVDRAGRRVLRVSRWRSGGSWTSRPRSETPNRASVGDLLRELRAAGPRRARAPLRPVRRVRGRRPGSAAGRVPAMADRRRPAPPADLAHDGGRAGADRRLARRQRPPAPRGARPRSTAPPRRSRRGAARRHAHAAVPVLPPGAVPALATRAHAARGRRPDHRADRGRRSWCRRPRSRSGSAGPRSASAPPAPGSNCPTRHNASRPAGRGAARALPDVQRGLHRQRRAGAAPRRPHRARRSGSPGCCTACCPATPRSPACSR